MVVVCSWRNRILWVKKRKEISRLQWWLFSWRTTFSMVSHSLQLNIKFRFFYVCLKFEQNLSIDSIGFWKSSCLLFSVATATITVLKCNKRNRKFKQKFLLISVIRIIRKREKKNGHLEFSKSCWVQREEDENNNIISPGFCWFSVVDWCWWISSQNHRFYFPPSFF